MLKQVPITKTYTSLEFEEIVDIKDTEKALEKMREIIEQLKENGDETMSIKGFGCPF